MSFSNIRFYGSGNSSLNGEDGHTVDILKGVIADHTLIKIDGYIFERHIAEKAGSKYQCEKCDMSGRSGFHKYCSPTHRCWVGATIETRVMGSPYKVEKHGKTTNRIFWKQVIPDPVNKINVVEVHI